ncbi:MAG: DNA cytosine methyltransferase, partial [Deltaproteobacteria bacterium]
NYRKNMLIHPYEDRGLSLREAARLQSFPDDFIFKGTLGSMQQQIGNAVPPLLAEAIFRQIIKLSC